MSLETNSKRKSVPTKPQGKMISLITLVHMFIVFDKRNGFGFSSELGEYFFLLQIISLDIVVIFWLLSGDMRLRESEVPPGHHS